MKWADTECMTTLHNVKNISISLESSLEPWPLTEEDTVTFFSFFLVIETILTYFIVFTLYFLPKTCTNHDFNFGPQGF